MTVFYKGFELSASELSPKVLELLPPIFGSKMLSNFLLHFGTENTAFEDLCSVDDVCDCVIRSIPGSRVVVDGLGRAMGGVEVRRLMVWNRGPGLGVGYVRTIGAG